jgi:hypothetical protein
VIRNNVGVPPLVAIMATFTSHVVYLLMAPPHHLKSWAFMVLGQLAYNSVLAVPAYFALRRLGFGLERSRPFSEHA